MATYPFPIPDSVAQGLTGASIGKGTAREVFAVPSDPDVVIKKLRGVFPGSNMVEWYIWNWVQTTPLANRFGKCLTISETAQYLFMERLNNLDTLDYADIPQMPIWLDDRKPDAFGKVNGVIKVRDYGLLKWDKLLSQTVAPLQIQLDAMNKRIAQVPGY